MKARPRLENGECQLLHPLRYSAPDPTTVVASLWPGIPTDQP